MKRGGFDTGEGGGKRARRVDTGRIEPPADTVHDPFAGIGDADREQAWKVLTEAFSQLGEFCSQVGDGGSISIKRRIGGVSSFGQVFEVSLGDTAFALKAMPHTGYKTAQANDQEIWVSTEASNLVVEGKSIYFPLMYAYGLCPNIHLVTPPLKDLSGNILSFGLLGRVNKWKSVKELLQRYVTPGFFKVYGKLFQGVGPFLAAAELKRVYKPGGPIFPTILEDVVPINLMAPVGGEYLALELAWGDLEAFIEKGPPEFRSFLDVLIQRTIEAITDMQTHLHIYHDDLHLGNILVQLVRNLHTGGIEPIPLINDFGEAEDLTPENQFEDVKTFMSSLLELKDKLPEGPKAKVVEFDNLVFGSTMDVYIWWSGVGGEQMEPATDRLSRYLA